MLILSQIEKNIMIIYKNDLLVGCKDKLIIIDVNNYENVFKIYSNNESIIYILNFQHAICMRKFFISFFFKFIFNISIFFFNKNP